MRGNDDLDSRARPGGTCIEWDELVTCGSNVEMEKGAKCNGQWGIG